MGLRQARFTRQPSWRVAATRHPPVAIFDRVTSEAEFDAAWELEAAFNPRADAGHLLLALPRSQWVFGPGSGHVLAPFAYRTPSRFSDGSFGVYYAALDETTAIQEVAFHRERFLATTHEPACVLEEQVLWAEVTGELTDIRGEQGTHPEWYGPATAHYPAAQALGSSLWRAGQTGLVFSSVRNPGGECFGIFRPRAISSCLPLRPLRYAWDGTRIASWA